MEVWSYLKMVLVLLMIVLVVVVMELFLACRAACPTAESAMANNVEDNRFPEFRRECIGAAIKLSTDKEATL